jgi:hypothetical protein
MNFGGDGDDEPAVKARRAHLEQDHATLKGHSVYLDEAHKQYTDALDLFIKELAGKVRISEQAGAPFVLYPLVMFDQACFRTFF